MNRGSSLAPNNLLRGAPTDGAPQSAGTWNFRPHMSNTQNVPTHVCSNVQKLKTQSWVAGDRGPGSNHRRDCIASILAYPHVHWNRMRFYLGHAGCLRDHIACCCLHRCKIHNRRYRERGRMWTCWLRDSHQGTRWKACMRQPGMDVSMMTFDYSDATRPSMQRNAEESVNRHETLSVPRPQTVVAPPSPAGSSSLDDACGMH